MVDFPNRRKIDHSRITAWEIALGHHVEALFADFPGGFEQAVVTTLAYELAQGFEAPTLRTGAERPDQWAVAIANAIKGLFPEEDVAAVTEFLAGGLAWEFDPPRRIGPRHAPGNRYTDKAYANKNHSERMGQSVADLSLREGAHIAAWQRSLAVDVHQIMPLDPLAADALTAALAVRLSTRYKPPCRRTPLPADNPL